MTIQSTVIRVRDKRQCPKGPHFAILTFGSVHTAGDERSRTHPGHGYPASSESVVYYTAYTDQAEWELEIKRATELRKEFVPLTVSLPTVSTEIIVKI